MLWGILFFISFSVFAALPTGEIAESLIPFYRDLHEHPELSLQEKRTAEVFAAKLKELGGEVATGVGGFGVVAVFKNGTGKTLLLRTDLDGLPVEEKTGIAYASKAKGKGADGSEVSVMHACGHDIHMANMVGTVKYLLQRKTDWKGTLVVIGQPAEEIGRGATAMLKEGLYSKFPKPDFALALHVDSILPVGKIAYISGPMMATADSVDITLLGKAGHGALPHETIDPVAMASHFVVDLQNIISRERNPGETSVISVGSFHCGTKHNVVSDRCQLQLTVRSFNEGERKRLLDGITRKARAAAESFGAPEPVIKISGDPTPALSNDKSLVQKLIPVWNSVLGAENVVEGSKATVSEDFSRYAEGNVPIAMFRLGSVTEKRIKKNPTGLHSGLYYPDPEPTLATGILAMSSAAISLLHP